MAREFADDWGDVVVVEWRDEVVVIATDVDGVASLFDFTPATARQIAAALIEAADKAEGVK